jgi:hypothetical protein
MQRLRVINHFVCNVFDDSNNTAVTRVSCLSLAHWLGSILAVQEECFHFYPNAVSVGSGGNSGGAFFTSLFSSSTSGQAF